MARCLYLFPGVEWRATLSCSYRLCMYARFEYHESLVVDRQGGGGVDLVPSFVGFTLGDGVVDGKLSLASPGISYI